MTDPILRIKFENADGKAVIPAIELRIPAEISPKLAKMLVLELVGKKIKAGLDEALKALGFK
jgi:hypothetical protein